MGGWVGGWVGWVGEEVGVRCSSKAHTFARASMTGTSRGRQTRIDSLQRCNGVQPRMVLVSPWRPSEVSCIPPCAPLCQGFDDNLNQEMG